MVSLAREQVVYAGEGLVYDCTFEVVMIKNCALKQIDLGVRCVHLSA